MGLVIFTVSLSEVYFRFLFLMLLGLLLGMAVYLIVRKPQSWRMRPVTFLDPNKSTLTKRCAIIVSSIIAFPFITFAYADTWQHFYKVSQDGERFYLHYISPKGVIELTETSKLEIDAQYEIRRGYRVKVVDKWRNSYSSQIMNRREAVENMAKMDDALKAYRRPNK